MGRSKFPGKPSKHNNRKRINVLSTPLDITAVGDTNNVVTVETEDSKKIHPETREGNEQTKVAVDANLKIKKTIAKKRKTRLVSKRATLKRAGMLATVPNKLAGINHVARRTRSNVKGRRSIRSFSTIRKVAKPKHSLNTVKESNNLVGKFVLPSRSVHSSRVIKPNKRFINVEVSETRAFKKCVVNKRLTIRTNDEKRKVISAENDKECSENSKLRSVREAKENSPSRVLHSNGKVVLRQARLQLHTQTAAGPEGPFSCNGSNNISPPGTVTCGVCGAVRFYRFVKQARKFNIYSCESCRKFISKMIKRQSNANSINVPTLVCHKGQGMCHVPPIVRSQHWKLFRCAYRARCPACWLKMCLRSFQMPVALKNNLAQLLPKNMQTYDSLFSSSLPLLTWQPNVESKTDKCSESPKIEEPERPPVRRRPVRFKAIKRDEKPVSPARISEIKRQKVDLKGPRVKHVCRSASIVLGQPLATFPGDVNKSDVNRKSPDEDKPIDSRKLGESKDIKVTSNTKNNSNGNERAEECITNTATIESKLLTIIKTTTTKQDLILKRERVLKSASLANTLSECKTVRMKKNLPDNKNLISIDFWENYDPDEVFRNGFGLISSQPFPMKAICFLCGSAGQEALMHCLTCCEPYHPYCLDQTPPLNFTEHNGKYNWLCPRCTNCSTCGEANRQKINCRKCHKAYHPNCFNTTWKSDEKLSVCSNCLKCKSCDTNNATKFIGNLAMCLECFKLRNKDNFCPLCQKCYNDSDFGTKIMECGKCKKWIHSKCELLSDEYYQILSFLPDSVEFLCHQCSSGTTPYWQEAVRNELKTGFNNVLRLLSRNQSARNILKLGSNKDYTIGGKPANTETNSLNKKETFEGQELKVESKLPVSPTMLDIKNKLNSNENMSLHDFHISMKRALDGAESEELLKIYRTILRKIFPWFNPIILNQNEKGSSISSKSRQVPVSGTKVWNHIEMPKDQDNKSDIRVCCFCKGVGDGLPRKEARILYIGQNEWVHVNCALWSSEVYEEIDGSLQNVHSALFRCKSIKCMHCKQKGASIGCCYKGCSESYHFVCAQETNCFFAYDKTVYCRIHSLDDSIRLLLDSSEFDIRRSVYVETERKRKKYFEPEKINFMVGSLSVTSLGKIIPVLSDDLEALIPSGFICSRLFWSTTEPWKLIPYSISTSVLNPELGNIYVDKNFTVDHSFPKPIVEKQLKEILMWQRDLSKEIVDSEGEEEPQNTADLLSPELTDALFEELPHDFLDGISVQDIVTSYEELLNMDFKSEINCNDNVSLNMNTEQTKKNFDGLDENDSDSKSYRELKRSKSEVFNQLGTVDKLSKNRSQQRSCSLTWSCKMDNSLTPAMKKRKINPRDNSMYLQLLQVDGACDSSGSECEFPLTVAQDRFVIESLENPVNFDKYQCSSTTKKRKIMNMHLLQVDGAYDSSGSECDFPLHESQDVLAIESSEEPVSCQRCQCTYRTRASYKRHLETCDSMSTSESDSEDDSQTENMVPTDNSAILVNVAESVEPNIVTSYETYSSYQASQNEVHATIMNSQTLVSAEATSEVIVPDNSGIFYPACHQQIMEQQKASVPIIHQPNISINQIGPVVMRQPALIPNQAQTALDDSQAASSLTINQTQISTSQQPTFCVNQQSMCVNQPNTLSLNHTGLISLDNASLALTQTNPISINPITINQSTPLPINQTMEIQQPVTIQSVPFTQDVAPILNIAPQNQITIDSKMLTAPCSNIVNSMVAQTVGVPQNHWVKPVVKPTVVTQKTIRARGRPRSLAAKKSRMPSGGTIIMSQPNSAGPSVILQHLPSSSMMPAFVDAFQQQSGQNLQYVATIAPQLNTAITPQTQIVLQPNNNFVNIMPGVQSAMIIQQPQVITDQLIVDGNGSMMWATQPVQPVQPVYYGFETIVQNTVMQSQQFLPTTMAGVLTTNSSYSATTQVFQTSKLEPVLDVTPGSFVVLNSGQIVNPQSIQIPSQLPHTVTQNIPTANLSVAQVSQQNKEPNWEPVERATITEMSTQVKPSSSVQTSSNNTVHSITLPVAPFVPEQGIPTNIVTPTPKPPTSTQSRPMSRVLPMQTNVSRDHKRQCLDGKIAEEKASDTYEKKNAAPPLVKVRILDNTLLKPAVPVITKKIKKEEIKEVNLKSEIQPLKFTVQKQNQEWKVEDSLPPKVAPPVQIVPLKPIKTKDVNEATTVTQITEVKVENSATENLKNSNTKPPVIGTKMKLTQEKSGNKNISSILYTVETCDGFRYSSTSIYDLWSKVFEAVQGARAAHSMAPLPANALDTISNLQLLGLKTNGLKYLLEQLPGASKCNKYKPNFYFRNTQEDSDDEIEIGNLFGAVRIVSYSDKKEPYDMFRWLASKHRKLEDALYNSEYLPRRGSSTANLPMAMRFRNLKLTSKYSVGVYRSDIHRRGLFSLRDIESGEMVIEYAGEVIRSILTDKREKYYNSKGIGCYMFRIDDNLVVDATMKGNAARFINHSCDPNCYSKVVEIHGHKHIIIFALRRIIAGEELTYDYKFPIEEDKIPCTCGARRCRKFLN